jgi:hypothetical protein
MMFVCGDCGSETRVDRRGSRSKPWSKVFVGWASLSLSLSFSLSFPTRVWVGLCWGVGGSGTTNGAASFSHAYHILASDDG